MRFILYFDALTALLCALIWVGIVAFLRLKKGKSLAYLLCFTIFYVYVAAVLYYTLFLYQSLLLLRHFMPGLILRGQAVGKSLNLIPLVTLRLKDVKTSLLNVMLFIPFGFGLPFITNCRIKQVVTIGALFSIGIELLQFISGFLAGITFRVADINDVLFNTLGVVVGYVLFLGCIRFYRSLYA